jgi:hypothetical protein
MSALEKAPALQTQVLVVNQSIGGAGPATGVDITALEGLVGFLLTVPVVAGTTPNMVVTLETSDALASGYATAVKTDGTNAVFTAVTVAGSQYIVCDSNQLKQFVRFNATTLTGTAAAFSTSLFAIGAKKVQP